MHAPLELGFHLAQLCVQSLGSRLSQHRERKFCAKCGDPLPRLCLKWGHERTRREFLWRDPRRHYVAGGYGQVMPIRGRGTQAVGDGDGIGVGVGFFTVIFTLACPSNALLVFSYNPAAKPEAPLGSLVVS